MPAGAPNSTARSRRCQCRGGASPRPVTPPPGRFSSSAESSISMRRLLGSHSCSVNCSSAPAACAVARGLGPITRPWHVVIRPRTKPRSCCAASFRTPVRSGAGLGQFEHRLSHRRPDNRTRRRSGVRRGVSGAGVDSAGRAGRETGAPARRPGSLCLGVIRSIAIAGGSIWVCSSARRVRPRCCCTS